MKEEIEPMAKTLECILIHTTRAIAASISTYWWAFCEFVIYVKTNVLHLYSSGLQQNPQFGEVINFGEE